MSVVAVLRSLLAADANVIAVVPATRIVAGVIPEGTALPAISVMEISTTEISHIDGTAPTTLADGRGDVTVMAASYPALKTLLALARKACNYKSGTINGFKVVSVRRIANGPDLSDEAAQFCSQSIEFSVIYEEPNT